jgi:hypothetical protein
MKLYVLRLERSEADKSAKHNNILFFLQTFITNDFKNVKKPVIILR